MLHNAAIHGDYLVEYEDGYRSISPKKAFEEGYSEVPEHVAVRADTGQPPMSFGDALEALKAGKRIARAGWNGKSMWLSLSGDGTREIPASAFWSTNNATYAEQQGGTVTMKTATGEILMGWLASQTDMLADDWTVISE